MTNRNSTPNALRGDSRRNATRLVQGLTAAAVAAGLAGCGTINSSFGTLLEPEHIDYKSASSAARRTPNLEVPPDLTQVQRDNRYALPDANRGVATASSFNQQRQETAAPAQAAGAAPASNASAAPAASATVAPSALADVRVERDGSQRWLVVKQSPEALWPQIRDFWQDNGFLIASENQEAGVMETDWAENRAKIPQDFIRNTVGKVFDSLYSTGERDKFRTRLERGPDGTTEIYISHRGAEEVLTGLEKERTVWTPRPPDPGLEAEFLSRLMARLGATDAPKAKVAVVQAPIEAPRAKLVRAGTGAMVQVDESFDRAWRRVGLALDRVGFTVEDRDRSQGIYFVRYIDQDSDADRKVADKGFFSRLFSGSKKDKASQAQRYRIAVKPAGSLSEVSVLNNDGAPETSKTGDRILSLLTDQLK
jgi:outer membrane protein assembly factor BamC